MTTKTSVILFSICILAIGLQAYLQKELAATEPESNAHDLILTRRDIRNDHEELAATESMTNAHDRYLTNTNPEAKGAAPKSEELAATESENNDYEEGFYPSTRHMAIPPRLKKFSDRKSVV